jgi:phage terminase large subunit
LPIRLPNGWTPRVYQRPAWDWLERGGRRALLFWHRRAGKDDVGLHRAACAAFERVGAYWHMLPEASQARKAIWDAVDPHLGRRRIDVAFPAELREVTRENEMFIRFRNGSTWQLVGSDNYDSLVGSPPIGLVSSEHALSNPAAWAYLRPILRENGGWFVAITTPRGRNHAYEMLQAHGSDPEWFTERLPATATNVFTLEQLESERRSYRSEYGDDQGEALYQQEYLCSFDAAVLGAYYAAELADARGNGRVGSFPWLEALPVYVAADLGRTDATALWFWQMVEGAPRFIDYHESNTKDVPFYADLLRAKPYRYAQPALWLPHDAQAETLAAPRSVQAQLRTAGFRSRIVPSRDLQDGIQAARATLRRCTIDAERCADGLEALGEYRRLWDDERRVFADRPLHNWASNGSDAFRYASLAWREDAKPEAPAEPHWRYEVGSRVPTFDELRGLVARRRQS